MTDAGAEPTRESWARTIGWAAYLGVSWTWCIGMFLPIILMRDFGGWAFAVFAIPNVVGAAAMGWMLRSSAQAAVIIEKHRVAVRAFTFVTIAFHCFWIGWMASLLLPYWWPPLGRSDLVVHVLNVVLPLALVFLCFLVASRRYRTAAVFIWFASLALGETMMIQGAGRELRAHNPFAQASGELASSPASLAFLAPVCIFGFLLCPYLDGTFLHARKSLAPKAARSAFGFGFGFFFFLMIVLTFGYSVVLDARGQKAFPAQVPAILFCHMLLQTVFTIFVHLRALPAGMSKPGLGFGLVVCGLLLLAGYNIGDRTYADLPLAEVVYRSFMAFYGLVFPAYVWLCMIPTRDGHAGMSGDAGRRKLLIMLGAVGVAAPFFWMGFIERETGWLAPGLGVVLMARLLIRRGRNTEKAGRTAE